eukprot:7319378-Alexandrium_andersonii.AAC.1
MPGPNAAAELDPARGVGDGKANEVRRSGADPEARLGKSIALSVGASRHRAFAGSSREKGGGTL